jgi:hypothetical protein
MAESPLGGATERKRIMLTKEQLLRQIELPAIE